MRSAIIDKITVVALAAVLSLWAGCLALLWGWATDTSGSSTVLTLAALLLALAAGVHMPGPLLRGAVRLAGRLRQGELAERLGGLSASRARSHDSREVLAAVAVFASLCGGLSTAAIFLAPCILDAAAGAMLFSPAAWAAFCLAVQFVGLLPLGTGIATAFLASGVVRGGSGHDLYATVFREWLWGLAAAMATLAALWAIGANLLGLAVGMAMLLLAGAAAVVSRQADAAGPARGERAIETALQARRGPILAAYAVLAMALAAQVRLLQDTAGVDTPGAVAWLAASLAMLAGFLRWADRKSHLPGERQGRGAALGVLAGLLLQGALLLAAVRGGWRGGLCCAMALITQISIEALAAIFLSRQRRGFAAAGGRAKGYVGTAALGAGAALLVYLLAMTMPYGRTSLLAGAMGAAAAAIVVTVVRAGQPGRQLAWAATGAATLLGLALAWLGAVHQAGAGTLRAGPWLTAILQRQGPARTLGALPDAPPWRGAAADGALAQVINEHRGRWLVAAASAMDVPPVSDAGVYLTIASPQTTLRGSLPIAQRENDFFAAARLGRARYDGMLLALLPAGHSQAWRCYNDRQLRSQLARLAEDGLVVLRVQADDSSLPMALAAVRTLSDAVGPCWVVVQGHGGRIDLLVAGPAERMDRPAAGEGAFVSDTRRLWYDWPGFRPIRLLSPGGVRSGPSVDDFLRRLAAQ